MLTKGLQALYPRLEPFFAACKSRVSKPGWMQNCFGRYRRFRTVADRQVMADLERQAMNFPEQSMVADAVSIAMSNLYRYRNDHPDIKYTMALQIHDAIVFEVPLASARTVWNEVIDDCMIQGVPIYPAYLDGKPTGKGPYRFGVGKDAYFNWGVELEEADLINIGLT